MSRRRRRARALVVEVSAAALLAALGASRGFAQAVQIEQVTVEGSKPKPAPRRASTTPAPRRAAARPAPAPAPTAVAPSETAWGPVNGYVATRSATGTKTDTPLIETPQSISIVPADQIRDQGAQSIAQALRYTPGVSVELNGATSRYDELRIRGFKPVQYLDGMALPLNQFFATPRIEPYGLERIEVLKGPASFLFGQNSPGGLLNMVSKRPTAERLNEVEVQYGSFQHKQVNFDFGGAADKDKQFLYRLTGVVRDANTAVDYTRDDVFFIAPAFTWRPTADTTLTVLTQYGWDKGTYPHMYLPAEGTLLPNPKGQIPRSRFAGEPGFDRFDREQYFLGYNFEHRFDDVWSVRQNVRYAAVDVLFNALREEGYAAPDPVLGVPPLTIINRNAFAIATTAATFTVDNQAQADFSTGPLRHKVLVGTDYLKTTGNYDFKFAPGPQLNIFNPVYGRPVDPLTTTLQKNHTSQDQVGFYAQDQIKYGPWLLTLGGRQDWVENVGDNLLAGSTASRKDTAFTGRAGLTYLFENGVAPYVSYATSFQPSPELDAAGQPFKPTTGRQYEAGVKYQPPGSKTLISAAVFDIVQQNAVTFDPQTFAGFQIGEVRVRGFDVDAKATLTRNVDLIASYAYLDSKITKSVNSSEVGRVVPLVPDHQAAVWVKYTFLEGALAGLSLGGGVRYVGVTFGETASLNPLPIPAYTLFDAMASYELEHLNRTLKGAVLSVNVTNVFDKYYVAGYCDPTYCSLGAGRVVLGSLRYKW
jgi:iron complex outermembrane recepter protein